MDDAGMPKSTANPSAIALTKFRKRAGMTMRELAKAAGYSGASSLQRYESPAERGAKYISMDVVERLAEALMGRGTPAITEIEVYSELAGGIPLKLVGRVGLATVQVTSTKPTTLPDGSRGLGLYSEPGQLAARLALSREAIRDIREDLAFLEDLFPAE